MKHSLPPITEVWVYLSGNPLFALVLTLSAYWFGVTVYERTQRNPVANPVLIAVALVAAVLVAFDVPYRKYFEGAQFVHFMLGTATVSLAIPIYKGWAAVRGRLGALSLALAAGAVTSIATALAMGRLFDLDATLAGGLYAKSVTAPIAMGIAERIHASPTLTAVYALLVGVLGAVFGRYVLNALRVQAWWARGFAIGVASHGIGTSRAFSVHPEAGAFASLGMGMHGVLGAALIPSLVDWLAR